ncbi:hypothetical protein BKA82DRAFT_2301383 [Pisolithus tinctorius]|nr:hypothetical protein BKA82DRAFT_2301383 [Pisolithus tinctorius]
MLLPFKRRVYMRARALPPLQMAGTHSTYAHHTQALLGSIRCTYISCSWSWSHSHTVRLDRFYAQHQIIYIFRCSIHINFRSFHSTGIHNWVVTTLLTVDTVGVMFNAGACSSRGGFLLQIAASK